MASFTSPPDVVTSTKVYDSLGVPHTITTNVHRTGTNQWDWTTSEDSGLPITNGSGTLTFDTKTGYVTSTPGGALSFTPVGADPLSITPDFSKVSQGFDETTKTINNVDWPSSTFEGPTQDGYPLGTLTGYNIDNAGRIVGIFSNGMNQIWPRWRWLPLPIPKVSPVVAIPCSSESGDSGAARIGEPGSGDRGTIASGTQEMSNVDLSQEFTR